MKKRCAHEYADALFDRFHQRLMRASSFNRAETLLDLYVTEFHGPDLPTHDSWFRAAGHHWTWCDDFARYRKWFAMILDYATRAQLDLMMDATEQAEFHELPSILTVYRGCYEENRLGLSWSLSRDIASRFPSKVRYCRSGKTPLLITGRVSKSKTFLKLDRGEMEIIAPRVRAIAKEALPIPVIPDQAARPAA